MTAITKRKPGAPVGNLNAAKGKWMTDGMVRALARDDWKRFNAGMEKLAQAFGKGERWALEMALDRIQGRPMPELPDTGSGDLQITWVMHAAPQHETLEHAPHPANASLGTIRADEGEGAGVPAIETDGGVGVGVTVLPHTSEVSK